MPILLPRLLGAAALLFACLPAPAQGPLTNAEIPRDDQKGRYLNFERAQLHPLELSADGSRLYTLNSPGARLVVFDTATSQRLLEIPVGIGAVSLARRPGSEELWVVDDVASTVSVVDPHKACIVRSLRVGAQPHGIVFAPAGDRAYVSCSAAARVDVIAASSFTLVNSIPIPARDPRGLVWAGGKVWVVPQTSGNNTAPIGLPGAPNHVVGVAKVVGPGLNPLPDRDLFAILPQNDPALDALDPSATVSGLGTTLFNVVARPGTSELWIPNTEALNAEHKGEKNFVAGQVVSNRISVVDTSGAQPPRVLDLDAIMPADRKCAQPTALAFDPNGTRVYVAAYGSDLVGVFDLVAGGQLAWAGGVVLPPKQVYPRGTGPRALLLGPGGTTLYVYLRIDNAVTAVDLAALPPSGNFLVSANAPFSLGFEGITDEERLGRHLFANAKFSKSLTSSCASCHIDGHLDGLAWNLGAFLDPEGTPDGQLAYPLDDKGALVTQSTRRVQDQAPYHWRGEKGSINDFQSAFPNLLENQVNGQTAEIGPDFQYLRHYLNHLVYPPNPRAALDRLYTPPELAGANLFLTKRVLGNLTCASCHQLPIGTGGDLVTEVASGVIRSADVPALRGVGDKSAPTWVIGGAFGTRTELGAGFTHGGAAPTLRDAVLRRNEQTGQPLFDLTPSEADQIVEFLRAFDSGLAPATGFLATANAANAASFGANELAYLKSQALAGNCDLVFYRRPRIVPGSTPVQVTGRFDTATGRFQPAGRNSQQLDDAFLLAEAAQDRAVTFVGLPLGMGLPFGLDRDCDGLWNLDELRRGTNPDVWDSDGDGYPDGYEVDWGMNPLATSSGTPDTQAPVLVGPVRLLWASTNTLKFEFDTSEMTKVWLSYNGGYVVQRLPLGPPAFDTHHDVVLDGLEPNSTIQLQLLIKDPAGNSTTDTSAVFHTRPRVQGEPAAIEQIALGVQSGVPVNLLRADVSLKAGAQPVAAGYLVQGSVYQVLFGGALVLVSNGAQALTNANGTASLFVGLPPQPALPSSLVFVVSDVRAPNGAPPYVLALNHASTATAGY